MGSKTRRFDATLPKLPTGRNFEIPWDEGRGRLMKNKTMKAGWAASILVVAGVASAGPSMPIETRAMGMGGTGVASANALSAAFYNPAMLSMQREQDDFALLLPFIAAGGALDDELIDDIDDIQDQKLFERFEDSVNQYNTINSQSSKEEIDAALDEVIDSARTLDRALTKIDHAATRLDASAALALAVPSDSLGFSVFTTLRLTGTALVSYRDSQTINEYIELAEQIKNNNSLAVDLQDVETRLESDARVIGVAINEIGVSLSRQFDVGIPLAIGVTPKYLRAISFDYTAEIEDFDEDDFDASEFEEEDSAMSLDIGVATAFGEEKQWIVGASIRDITSPEFETVAGQKIELNPRLLVGTAYRGGWFNWALDFDLTKNDGVGFESESQFLSTGAEFNVLDTIQLRVGGRMNISDDKAESDSLESDSLLTAGVGIAFFGAHLDFSAVKSSEEVAVGAELAFDI